METARTYLYDKSEALQEFSYDAWGNSRDPYTWTGTNTNRCMFERGSMASNKIDVIIK